MTGLALLIYGIIFLYRSEQSQAFWSSELQNSVKQQSRQEIADSVQFEAHASDQTLSDIALAVQQLADYQSTLFSREFYLGQSGYWDGNTKLLQQTGGQYANPKSDPASVFIPNTVALSPSFVSQLNTSMYLDFSAPSVLKENPIIVAVYYVGANNYTVYYPNIDLANAVPADFDAREQSFYTVAIPENDPERKPVWTAPYQDPAGTGLIVTVSVPVYDRNNQFRGVMSADIQLSKIAEQISAIKLGKTGFAFLIDQSGHIIAMPDTGYKLFGIEPEVVSVNESPKTTILGIGSADMQSITQKMVRGENGLSTATIQNTQYYVGYYPLPTIHYSIGLMAPTAELDTAYVAAREKIDQETHLTTTLSIVILLVVLLVVGAISLFLGQFLATPLVRLTETATEVAKGNLNVEAKVQTSDEIGILASTFNSMTSQIRELINSLEQRVAARTRNLELAAEVGRAVSQVRDLDIMLKDACELILKEFDLYYVQVYLTNPSQTALQLEAGTGAVGAQLVARGHNLSFDITSINGRAAVDKHTVVIADTAQSATFRKNPLLPDTRGEMAVPLIVADKVVGVLDMQSSKPGVLTEEVLPAFEALAGQLAIAIQNSNLLVQAEQARAEVEKQARRLVRTGWSEHLDAVHKPELLGFVFDRNEVVSLDDTTEFQPSGDEKVVSAPISVTGEALGSLVVELDSEGQHNQTNELVNIVARQVAQQIENLRLLESAERYRYEAEQAARRQTMEGWQQYMLSRSSDNLGYLYDTKEVRPYNESETQEMFALPLKARDEMIGKLGVQGLATEDQEAVDLVSIVAERLSAHIENLRLYDQSKSALMQSQKLFDASRRLTQAADLQDLVKAAVEALGIQEIDRVILGGLDYSSAGDLEGMTIIANWSNRSDLQATPVGTHYAKEALNAVSLFKSSQPLFFNDMLNDQRVDEMTLAIAKRLNYRAVAALPLYIGSRQDALLLFEGEQPHSFTAEEIRLFTSLAPQLATVLENRRQFEKAQRQAERESMLNAIGQKIQSATTVEAVLQIAARELGRALSAPLTVAQLGLSTKTSGNNGNGNESLGSVLN
jgi:GAF domain-containing protein/HAMP domain-containing protein